MAIEWQRLIDVRAQHERIARERVAQERRAADESAAQAQAAQQRLAQQVAGKASHWQAIARALDGGTCDVAQLRDAGAWSGALDRQIAQADDSVSQVQAVVAERQGTLEASRRRLRETAAGTERVRQMQLRDQARHRQLQEARIEEAAQEAAAQAWMARRSP